MKDSELFTHGALRADITLLRTEMGDALGPAFNTLSGLVALARKLEQEVTGLMESSARATQDILELRQELDGSGSLSGLAALAKKSEQEVIQLGSSPQSCAPVSMGTGWMAPVDSSDSGVSPPLGILYRDSSRLHTV